MIVNKAKPTEALAANLQRPFGQTHDNSASKRGQDLLPTLVDKLGTYLNVPEQEVIKQDGGPEDRKLQFAMYFIGKGDCKVNIRDERGREHEGVRLLVEGDHFGEISVIFGCLRSASVISRNYNTLAKMITPRFKELVAEYPEFELALKEHIRKNYRDQKVTFLLNMIQRVDYFKGVDDEILFDIMFNLEPKHYEKDSVVLANEHNANSLIFIEDGVLEHVTTFEQNEFILERLYRGSAINHRAFFMQDNMYVDLRCAKDSKILQLSLEKMQEIQIRYDKIGFATKMLSF